MCINVEEIKKSDFISLSFSSFCCEVTNVKKITDDLFEVSFTSMSGMFEDTYHFHKNGKTISSLGFITEVINQVE